MVDHGGDEAGQADPEAGLVGQRAVVLPVAAEVEHLGEALTEPRSASGRSMTAAELGGDVRADLLRGGAVDPEEARRLYDRASILFAEAVAEIEAGRVREGIS